MFVPNRRHLTENVAFDKNNFSPGFAPYSGLKKKPRRSRFKQRLMVLRGAHTHRTKPRRYTGRRSSGCCEVVGSVETVLNAEAAANSLGYLGKMGIEFSGRDQKRDVITSSTHGRARSGERSPESHRPESLVQHRWAPSRHMRTNGRIAAFDIEMLFLQYVVSCIIENRNAFSDSLFIYSVVFHYRTPAGSQKRHRLFFLNGPSRQN